MPPVAGIFSFIHYFNHSFNKYKYLPCPRIVLNTMNMKARKGVIYEEIIYFLNFIQRSVIR